MINKVSIIKRGGIELYSYNLSNKNNVSDSQLFSGLFYAIQSVSEEIKDPVSFIRLQNSVIYIKTYSDFTILLISSVPLKNEDLEYSLLELAKVTLLFFEKIQKFEHPKEFEDSIIEILSKFEKNDKSRNNINTLTNLSFKNRIAITGLGKAGKTSIKKKFFENWSIDKIKNISPTIGLENSKNIISFIDKSVIVLDFGGQANYRKNYLNDKKNWTNLSSLIFVVDIQTPDLFSEAKDYLDEIFNIVVKMNPNKPHLSIFMHKFDSKEKKKIENNLNQFFLIFKEYSKHFTFFLTSIEDESSIHAMMKTIFFSLPNIMIKQIFERVFLDKLESELFNENMLKKIQSIKKEDLFNLGLSMGQELTNEFQNQWLNSYLGNINPSPRGILSKQVNYKLERERIKIEIQNWVAEGIPCEITNPILSGIIRGILNSLFINNEVEMVTEKIRTIWYVNLN